MMRLFGEIADADYQVLMYAHSKSDTVWRQTLLQTLSQVDERLLDTLRSPSTKLAMLGAYAYPFDYFNLKPYLALAQQLGLSLVTDWERVYAKYPSAKALPFEQRIAWAKEHQLTGLRPEIDLEYAEARLGARSQECDQQLMQQGLLKNFIADGVMQTLNYFPGNFFWLKHEVIKRLAKKINFADEFDQLPLGLSSDMERQSRAHAWERILPVFVEKIGLFARPLGRLKS